MKTNRQNNYTGWVRRDVLCMICEDDVLVHYTEGQADGRTLCQCDTIQSEKDVHGQVYE